MKRIKVPLWALKRILTSCGFGDCMSPGQSAKVILEEIVDLQACCPGYETEKIRLNRVFVLNNIHRYYIASNQNNFRNLHHTTGWLYFWKISSTWCGRMSGMFQKDKIAGASSWHGSTNAFSIVLSGQFSVPQRLPGNLASCRQASSICEAADG